MFRLLLAMLFFPWAVFATPAMQALLDKGEYLAPVAVMEQFELQNKGTIYGFGVVLQNEELVYKFSTINIDTQHISQLDYRAINGELIAEQSQAFDATNTEQMGVVELLRHKQLTFSSLVSMAIKGKQGYLMVAVLDHDPSISYLELKLRQQASDSTIAFDIENLRPLPLLKWD